MGKNDVATFSWLFNVYDPFCMILVGNEFEFGQDLKTDYRVSCP